MLEESLSYLLVVAAIGIGWWLGRSQTGHVGWGGRPPGKGSFLRREGAQDSAIASFISSLEVNSDTLETHLALAGLLRRRGEVDKAVTLHENLLSRAQLNRAVLLEVKLELARDYLRAGLLDRAEVLLKELQREDGDIRRQALEHLIDIYAREREWQKAIDTVGRLEARFQGDDYLSLRLAHFHCELAEQALHGDDLEQANRRVAEAFAAHANSVRASLLRGLIEYETGRPEAAVAALEQVRRQDVRYVPMALDLLEKCYAASDELPPDRLEAFLRQCLAQQPAVSVALALSRMEQRRHGKEAAARYLSAHLKGHSTLRGLTELIDMHMEDTQGAARTNLSLLRSFTDGLLKDKPGYRCRECGFAANRIHWCCPTCRQWSSLAPIYGVEGE